MKEKKVDQLHVQLYANREQLGKAAAHMVCETICKLLQEKEFVNIIFAAAASQNEFLAALANDTTINWSRVNAFHMDEYIGLEKDHPQRFGVFLKTRLFDNVPLHKVYYLWEQDISQQEEIERYTAIMEQNPPDITCMGIGENTHLAFNDPHVADFNDPHLVKVVDLDEPCKQQQVNEGCFGSVAEVPVYAFTLTIPALLKAKYIYCMVPGQTKANAVYQTLHAPVSERYPSTSLRNHEHAVLFLDEESAKMFVERQPALETE